MALSLVWSFCLVRCQKVTSGNPSCVCRVAWSHAVVICAGTVSFLDNMSPQSSVAGVVSQAATAQVGIIDAGGGVSQHSRYRSGHLLDTCSLALLLLLCGACGSELSAASTDIERPPLLRSRQHDECW